RRPANPGSRAAPETTGAAAGRDTAEGAGSNRGGSEVTTEDNSEARRDTAGSALADEAADHGRQSHAWDRGRRHRIGGSEHGFERRRRRWRHHGATRHQLLLS